jgi:hypothetical protein
VVLGERDVREEVNVPVPVPFDVFVDSDITGVGLVDQTTPRAVTLAPPSALTFPPEVAVVVPKSVTVEVERVGTDADTLIVLKLTSLP